MNKKTGVIIPFVTEDYIHNLLADLEHQTRKPDLVLLIDNRPDPSVPLKPSTKPYSYIIGHHKPVAPLSVNAAWNYGIQYMIGQGDIDLISVFNDDLILSKRFFENLVAISNQRNSRSYGVFCPETIVPPADPSIIESKMTLYQHMMSKREGWAWTIRTKLAKEIPPIPTEGMKTFCGDDWYYVQSYRHGMMWMKMGGVMIYHYIGGTLKTVMADQKKRRNIIRNEKKIFRNALAEFE